MQKSHARTGLATDCFAFCTLTFALGLLASVAMAADWPTGRGNAQRTGNLDDKPGPAAPRILWVHKAAEQFIASPVPGTDALFVSSLGPFNTGLFHALALDPAAAQREMWSKSAPLLKLPMVCAPALVDGLLVFGDGMHQTDGATLYGVAADTGLPLWQLPLPGKLIHLEGSPTVADGKVFTGGGDAGVLCVDATQFTLNGRPCDRAGATKLMNQAWADLKARYEVEKQKDPDFALPMDENALPKPAPRIAWQAGKGKLHVDAPVAVVGKRVLAASAFIDADKVGQRALVCLNVTDGAELWRRELKINPWGGPTVADDLVIVGCSTIRLDKKDIPQARGEVLAVDLATGAVKWRKDIPGGVLSAVAIKKDLAIFTATDAKVRAVSVLTGEPKWTYDAGNPFFAGVAVAGDMVVAADLKGVVHAIGLADGRKLWTLDLATDPNVQMLSMAFGSPIIHQGRVYLATCNLEGDAAGDQPCVVVCIGDKSAGGPDRVGPAIEVDKERRSIVIPARIAPRKLPALKEVYPLEVVATLPSPMGQKAHETVVTFEARPSDVHKALVEMGLKPGGPARGDDGAPTGPLVNIYLEFTGVNDQPRRLPIERAMVDNRSGRPLPAIQWRFTGSSMRQPDPDRDFKVYAADLGGTLITIFPVTEETVFQGSLTMRDSTLLRVETNRNVLPEIGTPVKLIIEASDAQLGASK